MTTAKSFASLCLSSTLVIGAFLLPSLAFADSCQHEMKEQVAKLSLPKEKIKSAFTVNLYHSSPGILTGVDGYVEFNDCKGNLVLKFNRICQLDETYTTGSCKVVGIKNY